jgi:hypothetical protein
MGAALAHTLIDFHLGGYGTPSSSMSLPQGANVVLTSVVAAVHASALGLGPVGSQPALTVSLVLAVGWVFLGNRAAILIAPPPSDAFPYQDLAHLTCLVFGASAGVAIWRRLRRMNLRWHPIAVGGSVALVVALFAAEVLAT